jgi:hypothetical protein
MSFAVSYRADWRRFRVEADRELTREGFSTMDKLSDPQLFYVRGEEKAMVLNKRLVEFGLEQNGFRTRTASVPGECSILYCAPPQGARRVMARLAGILGF